MPDPHKAISASQLAEVNRALTETRSLTSAVILPVVADSTGRHDRTEDAVGLWAAALGFALVFLLLTGLSFSTPWLRARPVIEEHRVVAILASILGGFIAGLFMGSRLDRLCRLLVPKRKIRAIVEDEAQRVLQESAAALPPEARDRAVLLYVSLDDRVASLAAAPQIRDKLPAADARYVCDPVFAPLRLKNLGRRLCEGISRAAEVLHRTCPPQPGLPQPPNVCLRIIQ